MSYFRSVYQDLLQQYVQTRATEQKIASAVIPAVGRGNRVYPLTRSVPKELLPLVGRPVIPIIMEEGVRARIGQLHVVTSPQKLALRELSSPEPEENPCPRIEFPRVSFIVQERAHGLGYAVLQVEEAIENMPFMVQLPDDIFHEEDPLLQTMLRIYERTSGHAAVLMGVGLKGVGACFTITTQRRTFTAEITGSHKVSQLPRTAEKPTSKQVQSLRMIMGRYVLDLQVFKILERAPPNHNDEAQFTGALVVPVDTSPELDGGIWDVVSRGCRFDTDSM